MDEATRLTIQIEHSKRLLDRISATKYLTDSDRRHAKTLRDSIAAKQEMLNRLNRWMSPNAAAR